MKIFFRKNPETFFGKFIVGYTGFMSIFRGYSKGFMPYSHCGFVFSDGKWWEANEANGVNGTRYFDAPADLQNYDFLDLPFMAEEEERVRAFCDNELYMGDGDKVRYDRVGVILSQLPIPLAFQSESKWFCSESVVAGLQTVLMLTGVTPSRLCPAEVFYYVKKEMDSWLKRRSYVSC